MSNWGYIVPHTKKAQGAVLKGADGSTIESEYGLGLKIATELDNLGSILSETRDIGGVYGASRRLIGLGCKFSLEDHKNAFNKSVGGFEVLVLKGQQRSKIAAELLVETFVERLPNIKLRASNGIKFLNSKDRGATNLRDAHNAGMEICLLPEPFFIDNIDDWIPTKMLVDIYLEFFKKAEQL